MTSEQGAVWYYTQHGERKGPVTLDTLKGAITHMKVDRTKDLVWGPGLSDWVKVDQVPELQGLAVSPPPVAVPAVSSTPQPAAVSATTAPQPVAPQNPYASPKASEEDNALSEALAARHSSEKAGGLGRLGYFFANVVLYGAFGGMVAYFVGSGKLVLPQNGEMSPEVLVGFIKVMLVAVLVAFFAILFIAGSRFKNLRMSRWWILALWVPFLNIWLGYRLFACPPGYNEHKKLDTAGKVLTVIYVLLIVADVALNLYVNFMLPQLQQA